MKKNETIPIPKQVSLLAEAVQCTDPESARALVVKALKVMNHHNEYSFDGRGFDPVEIDAVINLIRGINPKDTVEMVLASQFIATHFQGMTKLSEGDTSHGMMLTRLSHQALDMLQKYRQKGSNINVNYFVHNEGQAVLQTNIGKNLEKKAK